MTGEMQNPSRINKLPFGLIDKETPLAEQAEKNDGFIEVHSIFLGLIPVVDVMQNPKVKYIVGVFGFEENGQRYVLPMIMGNEGYVENRLDNGTFVINSNNKTEEVSVAGLEKIAQEIEGVPCISRLSIVIPKTNGEGLNYFVLNHHSQNKFILNNMLEEEMKEKGFSYMYSQIPFSPNVSKITIQ